jgi:hypothetical protein
MRLNSPVSAERLKNPKKNRPLGRHEDNFRGRDLAADTTLRHCDHMPQYYHICAISSGGEEDAAPRSPFDNHKSQMNPHYP